MIRTASIHPTERRGTILVVVVVLLFVTAAIAGAVLRASMLDARQYTTDRKALQADRLAEAGLARAAARLGLDPEYDGEEWTAELPGDESATVSIRITEADGGRTIEAVAVYPNDSDRPVRSRRRMTSR